MKFYISKANFSWSKQLTILVLRTFEFDTEKSQVLNFSFIIFRSSYTGQDPASIHLHPDCNPYGKQAPWLMTDPSPWDHPCLVIFLPSGSTPFFFAYMYAIFKFNQLALLHFTRYTDIKPAAISDCSQIVPRWSKSIIIYNKLGFQFVKTYKYIVRF